MIVKRTFWFLLLLLSFVLVACGGGETAVNESAPAEEVVETAVDTVETVDAATLPDRISVGDVLGIKEQDDVYLVDVREQWEYDEAHISGVNLIPMGEIPKMFNDLPQDKEIILTCRSGNRSGQVLNFLKDQGFTNVHNMEGGIVAWQAAGYDVE